MRDVAKVSWIIIITLLVFSLWCFFLALSGCQTRKPETLLESSFFPVRAEVNGVPFDELSILDIIEMEDFNDVKITPVRKKSKKHTHYLVTSRAIEKLRPKPKDD